MERHHWDLGERRLSIEVTDRSDGDQRHARPTGTTWLRQVHGGDVVVVSEPGDRAGASADAAVTAASGARLTIRTADCAAVVLASAGAVGIAHIGWRGLVAGLLETTAEALERLGAPPSRALVGPTIRAQHYEFGATDLDRVAQRYGDGVRSTTSSGAPALDLVAGIERALADLGVDRVVDLGYDTADAARWYSHRLRHDAERQSVSVELGP